ncbi:MAG: four-carbon acid sugar kinase family protein [Dehalococcoidales bacterium]
MTAQTLGIVADDLTGAMDSSGYFASMGFSTVVILDPAFPSTADVVVITTNSRAEGPDIAGKRVRQAVRSLAGRVVYKKIDSTLRGNIGVELEAAMEELAGEKVVVAPAFPAVGRTTVDGMLLVNGVPVAETQFANDPILPVKESHIPSLLERATKRQVGCIAVEDIEAGAESLYRKISERRQDIVVCDVTEQSHLTGIAQAAALAKGQWLLCGSGGLARELHLLITKVPKASKVTPSSQLSGPALVVVGTRNQVAANQLLKARDELGLPILNLAVERLSQEDVLSGKVESILAEADRLLDQGKGVALSSTFSQYIPALRHTIPALMAEVVAGILAARKFAGLFLSGGDIAVEVCRRLSIAAIRVHGEVEPGVPAGELTGGQGQGMRVVTKAGGFGTEEALVKSVAYLEKGYLS